MEIKDIKGNHVGIIENDILKVDQYEFYKVDLNIRKNDEQSIAIDKHQWENKKYEDKKLVDSLQSLINNGDKKEKTEIEFCKFSIDKKHNKSGVYIWIIGDEIIYIGKAKNLAKRFNQGYGRISPRNCYAGGQSTNCKMNHMVYEMCKQGKKIDICFMPTDKYDKIEKYLLEKIETKYNEIK